MPTAPSESWYARNAGRAYPLDDAATGRDDAGAPLPPDVLVDCALRWPDALGDVAFLAAAAATPGGVTLAFAACPGAARPSSAGGAAPGTAVAAAAAPIAAVAVPAPVPLGFAVPVTPLAGGVAGHVVLGPGALRPYAGRLSTPGQGALLPRCAAPYPPLPVASLSKPYLAALGDLVTVAAGTDLAAAIEPRGVGTALVLRLASAPGADLFARYKGPCGGRPESNSCGLPDITQVAGVGPDPATGDLRLRFPGAAAYPLAGGGGLALTLPRTLAGNCPPPTLLPGRATGRLPAAAGGDVAALCSDDVVFGADPPEGFLVASGRFASTPGGYVASDGGINLAWAELAATPAGLAVDFWMALDPAGASGGVAFGYSGAEAPYFAAYVDGVARRLVVARVDPRSNPLALAAVDIPTSGVHDPYPLVGPIHHLAVTLSPSATPGMTLATAYVALLRGYAEATAELPLDPEAAGVGVFTAGGTTTFLELRME